MKAMSIKEILAMEPEGQEVETMAWVRTFRSNRFISLYDGSTPERLQAVIDFEKTDESLLKQINTGAALRIKGELIESQGSGQKSEIAVTECEVIGESNPEEYPLQPKKHSLEFLREIAHLRPRTNTFGAVFRMRHAMSFAVQAVIEKVRRDGNLVDGDVYIFNDPYDGGTHLSDFRLVRPGHR